jgi:hypothetical protein
LCLPLRPPTGGTPDDDTTMESPHASQSDPSTPSGDDGVIHEQHNPAADDRASRRVW